MFISVSQPEGLASSRTTREVIGDYLHLLVMVIFAGMSIFPAQALAFATTTASTNTYIVFDVDPSLENFALVGIEAFPEETTVNSLINSSALAALSTLTEGSEVTVLSVAYSSTPDQTDGSPNITASGKLVEIGTIAANFLPFGTMVRIDYNTYTVTDRMNSRYNGKYIVDIWKPTRLEAVQYGARIAELEVVSLP